MALKRLSVANLRNLSSVDIQPGRGVNLIYGANGSGKTSLLEAINILGLGRSFRSHKLQPVINRHADSMTVFGRLLRNDREIPVGIQRHLNGQSSIKVDGRPVDSAAKLAQHLPVQLIDAHSFLLLEGVPKNRRQFVDWLVFHVKPGFYLAWKNAQQCIKHRNSLLRRGRIDPLELRPWDSELTKLAHHIDLLRQETVEAFLAQFSGLVEDFVAIDGLAIDYYRGWDRTTDYSEVLAAGLEKDRRQGYTGLGPHRADLRIKIAGQNAADILSRGQQKLLVCAMRLSQGAVYNSATGGQCVYLVDDLPAELDAKHRRQLAYWLSRMQSQVFVTGVEKKVLLDTWSEWLPEVDQKVFHVEQGKVKEENHGWTRMDTDKSEKPSRFDS